ncbi:MAG: PIG-L family deacetylase [Acidimicrobiales bacterium]|nr:PIG-L family deacetylase [Acidimicrobiales bacterium]
MATLVTFHAHPDDEAIATGGTMRLAADAGHDVVLVTATRGECGEPVPGVLAEGEQLWERRVTETLAAAEILGAKRVEFLGYRDSGMMGEPTNDDPACFWRADLDEAAERLAAILREVGADVLTIYDEHGGYGHPDHIKVHQVGRRAAELAGIPRVFQATMNRTRIMESMRERAQEMSDLGEFGDDAEKRLRRIEESENSFGSPEEEITHAIDVASVVDAKRAAMVAHRSQIADDSFFLKMPPEMFTEAFGTEWFIELGRRREPGTPFWTDLFDGLS